MLVRKSRGNTLIETILSMLILSTILMGTFNFYRVKEISEEAEKQEMKATYQIDAVKKLILCNMSYKEIEDTLVQRNRFINSNYLSNDNLSRGDIKEIMKTNVEEYPYIMLTGYEEINEEVIKIKVSYIFQDKREIEHVFYKGNYEKV